MRTISTDVLVVGAGGGGAYAAYEASKHGVSVTVVAKDLPERGGSTIMAPGAIAAVGDWAVPGDSRDVHFEDTVRGGAFMGEQRLARLMVNEVADLVVELESIGAQWQRGEGPDRYALRIDGGHRYARCPFLEDRTGREMLRTVVGELRRRGVRLVPEVMITRLLRDGEGVVGAVGIDLNGQEIVLFRAKSVILACGGAGQAYRNTSCPTGVTGDGFILALDAGAELMDMEFVQFFPLGFTFPESLRGCLGGLLFHVHLLNSSGERFMTRYDPERLELSTRDQVSRAMFAEVREGRGGPNGGVFADMSYHEAGFIPRMQPALYETYRKIGFDPNSGLLELAPTCHFFMGGVVVDEDWGTTVPGLYAVGENAAGVHGGNRLSQNALAELLVSGARGGRAAALCARKARHGPVEPREAQREQHLLDRLLSGASGVRPSALRRELRQTMWEKAGVWRTDQGLREALDDVDRLGNRLNSQVAGGSTAHKNYELREAIENHFLVRTARCIAQSALLRTESRGAHFRQDHPHNDDAAWLRHIVLKREGGELRQRLQDVDTRELRP